MATQINHPAVRAFGRVWQPIAERLSEAEDADAGFDAGEWSGPAHATIQQDEWYATLDRVGSRFGLSAAELDDMIMAADMDNAVRFMEAHR